MAELKGQSIGRYDILDLLGEGGMAVVYRAHDTRLDCDVAVKFIRLDTLASEAAQKARRRFEREAKALARLTHPNIVKVSDYGEYQGAPYLVMSYLPGGTLRRYMGSPMPYAQAARLLLPIARALELAHSEGIIHRDIKPANILLTAQGEPMLSDFGIAKLLESEDASLTATGVGIGTPEYMAPEQVASRTTDHRVDIYALGVVFYELVTGRKPYTAETPLAVLVKASKDPLPDPALFAPSLAGEARSVIFKALAKNPAERYARMADFAAALERLTAGAVTGMSGVDPRATVYFPQAAGGAPRTPTPFPVTPSTGSLRPQQPSTLRRILPFLLGGAFLLVVGLFFALGLGAVIFLPGLRASPTSGSIGMQAPSATPLSGGGGGGAGQAFATPTLPPVTTPAATAAGGAGSSGGLLATATPLGAEGELVINNRKPYYPSNNCPKTSSRLKLKEMVLLPKSTGNMFLRSSSDAKSSKNIVLTLKGDTVLLTTGGPFCDTGWLLWEVVSLEGHRGWVAESDGKEHWLEPLQSWEACAGYPNTFLRAGYTAQVGKNTSRVNNVRRKAGTEEEKIGELLPGETMTVLEGPVCATGYVWWKVSSNRQKLTGWTAEVGEKLVDYYLFPVP